MDDEVLLEQSQEKEKTPLSDSIFVKQGNTLNRIKLDEIRYLAAEANYTSIFLSDKSYTERRILGEFEKNFVSKGFLRIHRSYIINLRHLISIKTDSILLDTIELPIGRVFKDRLMNSLP